MALKEFIVESIGIALFLMVITFPVLYFAVALFYRRHLGLLKKLMKINVILFLAVILLIIAGSEVAFQMSKKSFVLDFHPIPETYSAIVNYYIPAMVMIIVWAGMVLWKTMNLYDWVYVAAAVLGIIFFLVFAFQMYNIFTGEEFFFRVWWLLVIL